MLSYQVTQRARGVLEDPAVVQAFGERIRQFRVARDLEVTWNADLRRKAGKLLKEEARRRQSEELERNSQAVLAGLQPLPPHDGQYNEVCYKGKL